MKRIRIPRILKPWIGKSVARKKHIRMIPDIFDYETMLYIGANPRRIELADMFYLKGYEIDVLEIWEPNQKALLEWNKKWKIFRTIFLGDVRLIERIAWPDNKWDIILFWHGPEHLPKMDVAPMLEKLEQFANHLVILGCPRGEYEQDPVDGNPHERHECFLYEEDFHALGYCTATVRPKKPRGSNITAWKRINEK